MKHPSASLIINSIGPRMGITVELEPEFGFAGELIFPNERTHLFYNTSLNINLAGSAKIAKDKHYTKYFLSKKGIHVPDGKTFFSDNLCTRLQTNYRRGTREIVGYAQELGWPVFIKPNNSSEGNLVYQVKENNELLLAAKEIFEVTDVLLVESSCPGKDYRVVVLDNEIVAVYNREPMNVLGDGTSSVSKLLDSYIASLLDSGRINTNLLKNDKRIDYMLLQKKMNRESVLEKGAKLTLFPNANLSSGGTAVDVTDKIHPDFVSIAFHTCKILGLRVAGIDIICEDITSKADKQTWNVLEVNDSPCMDNFSKLGAKQLNMVVGFYSKILHILMEENK